MVRDAELKHTQSGTAVLNGSIANNYRKKSGEEWTEEANFFDLTLFGRRAEALAQYMTKGTPVAVAGKLRQDRWQNSEGQNRSRVHIIIDNIELLGRGTKTESSGDPVQDTKAVFGGEEQESFEDDVPF
jgi:single-strand DNA-binding protein